MTRILQVITKSEISTFAGEQVPAAHAPASRPSCKTSTSAFAGVTPPARSVGVARSTRPNQAMPTSAGTTGPVIHVGVVRSIPATGDMATTSGNSPAVTTLPGSVELLDRPVYSVSVYDQDLSV